MTPSELIVLAIIIVMVAVIVISSREKKQKGLEVVLPGNEPVLKMAPWGIPYVMHTEKNITGGKASKSTNNELTVRARINLGKLKDYDSHISINLRNKSSVRNNDNFPKPGSVTLGHGIIIGVINQDYPNTPDYWNPRFCAVIENFGKDNPDTILILDSASPELATEVDVVVTSKRVGDEFYVKYTLGEYDSGWRVTPHPSDKDGDDLTFAMFPLVPDIEVVYQDVRIDYKKL